MTLEHRSRRRRALTGATLVAAGSLGLATLPLTSRLAFVSDGVVFSLVFALAALMAVGATLAVFNLKA
jgi:hypothetical protein